ncbi:MAG: hypothetical protein K2G89_08035 [Lachnospiraceae bacterium]|nr:hypothetical protein [Lachnospiraceae bacterium]
MMNMTSFNKNTAPGKITGSGSLYAGQLPMLQNGGLKSTQEKIKRQEKMQGQIEFWENQKANLKNSECSTVEEIKHKLAALHNYNDEIAAAKMAYNQEQALHALDEAQEWGEKVAEEAEKHAPKTKEERRRELLKKALGIDEDEELPEELEALVDNDEDDGLLELLAMVAGKENEESMADISDEAKLLSKELVELLKKAAIEGKAGYSPLDVRI